MWDVFIMFFVGLGVGVAGTLIIQLLVRQYNEE